MENLAKISCSIGTTDASRSLGLELLLDNRVIYTNNHVTETIDFSYEFDDSDAEHVFGIRLKNKTRYDTQVAADGTIISDARLTVTNIRFDDIELGQLFTEQSVYLHDFNGTQDPIEDQFFGELGCNGTISFRFRSPVYMWLLESI